MDMEGRASSSFVDYDAPVLPSPVELCVLCGPPFSGKTLYLRENFALTHTRVAIAEESGSLHSVVKLVVGLLRAGRNVVLDGEHSRPDTRAPFVAAARRHVPHARLRAVNFLPVAGLHQCLWAREHAVAERAQVGGLASASEVRRWFTGPRVAMARRHEGYVQVALVRSQFYSNVALEAGGLLVDAAALWRFERAADAPERYEVRLVHEELPQRLHEWQRDSGGRVIVLVAESLLFPAALAMYAEEPITYTGLVVAYRQQLMSAVRSLTDTLAAVCVVAHEYAFTEGEWALLACAQRLHRLSFSQSICMLGRGSVFEPLCAQYGLRTLSVERMCETSGWNGTARVRRYTSSPPAPHEDAVFLRDVWYSDIADVPLVPDAASFAGRYWERFEADPDVGVMVPTSSCAAGGDVSSAAAPPPQRRKMPRVLPKWLREEEQEADDQEQDAGKGKESSPSSTPRKRIKQEK